MRVEQRGHTTGPISIKGTTIIPIPSRPSTAPAKANDNFSEGVKNMIQVKFVKRDRTTTPIERLGCYRRPLREQDRTEDYEDKHGHIIGMSKHKRSEYTGHIINQQVDFGKSIKHKPGIEMLVDAAKEESYRPDHNITNYSVPIRLREAVSESFGYIPQTYTNPDNNGLGYTKNGIAKEVRYVGHRVGLCHYQNQIREDARGDPDVLATSPDPPVILSARKNYPQSKVPGLERSPRRAAGFSPPRQLAHRGVGQPNFDNTLDSYVDLREYNTPIEAGGINPVGPSSPRNPNFPYTQTPGPNSPLAIEGSNFFDTTGQTPRSPCVKGGVSDKITSLFMTPRTFHAGYASPWDEGPTRASSRAQSSTPTADHSRTITPVWSPARDVSIPAAGLPRSKTPLCTPRSGIIGERPPSIRESHPSRSESICDFRPARPESSTEFFRRPDTSVEHRTRPESIFENKPSRSESMYNQAVKPESLFEYRSSRSESICENTVSRSESVCHVPIRPAPPEPTCEKRPSRPESACHIRPTRPESCHSKPSRPESIAHFRPARPESISENVPSQPEWNSSGPSSVCGSQSNDIQKAIHAYNRQLRTTSRPETAPGHSRITPRSGYGVNNSANDCWTPYTEKGHLWGRRRYIERQVTTAEA